MNTVQIDKQVKPSRKWSVPFLRPEFQREWILTIVFMLIVISVAVATGSVFWQQAILIGFIYVIAAAGLSMLNFQAKQISFGQGAILGVAGYVMALAITVWEFPVIVGALIGFLAGMLAGFIMSLPSLRLQGYYLGFVTMAAALALPEILIYFKDITQAMTGVNVQRTFMDIQLFPGVTLVTVAIPLLAIAAVTMIPVIRSSRLGRKMLLAGEAPEAASSLGIRPGRMRIIAFAIASAAASLAGVMYVFLINYVAPGSFVLQLSILIFFIVVLGGAGTISGTVIGVTVLYLLPDVFLASFVDYRLLIYGVIAFAVMYWMPNGLSGGFRDLFKKVSRKQPDSQTELLSVGPFIEHARETAALRIPVASTDENAIELRKVTKNFGALRALNEVDLELKRGTIHAIVGPNGSGKTTLLNAISGYITPTSEVMKINGEDVSKKSVVSRSQAGLGRTFQKPRVLTDLTVWENIDCSDEVEESASDFTRKIVSMKEEFDKIPASVLPHGQRRTLELIRVLSQQPEIMALDEPAAGLSHAEREDFSALLRAVVGATGMTILIVEHDLQLVWGLADKITVLDRGTVITTGTPEEVRNDPRITNLFTGVNLD